MTHSCKIPVDRGKHISLNQQKKEILLKGSKVVLRSGMLCEEKFSSRGKKSFRTRKGATREGSTQQGWIKIDQIESYEAMGGGESSLGSKRVILRLRRDGA